MVIAELLADEHTNAERRKAGLSELEEDEVLRDIARAHSEDMFRRSFFSHDNPDGLKPGGRVHRGHRRLVGEAGENIWMCTGCWKADADALAEAIVLGDKGWMNSPRHRDNILRKKFTHVAVGLSQHGKDVWATQVFSSTRGYLVADVPSRIERGGCLLLEVEPHPESGTQAVRFELFSPGTGTQVIDASPLGNMAIDAAPGQYTLRFHFPVSATRFAVVTGPTLEVN